VAKITKVIRASTEAARMELGNEVAKMAKMGKMGKGMLAEVAKMAKMAKMGKMGKGMLAEVVVGAS